MVVGIAPTHREKAVEIFPPSFLCSITENGEIGDHSHVPEQERDREIGRDREYVPFQRTAELRPNCICIRQWEQPPSEPNASYVEQGEDARAYDGEYGHRLGGAVDRGTPLLTKKQQYR